MAKQIAIFLFICSPVLLWCQSGCLDEELDCSSVAPVEVEVEVPFLCGDTLSLSPSSELCNSWTVPMGVNFEYGTGSDSSMIQVFTNQCFYAPVIVDGITLTANGTDTSACETRIIYQLIQPDTIQEEIFCEDFLDRESPFELIESPCGCGEVIVEYTADLNECVPCGLQCIYITGTTTITGGETEGANVAVTYVLNGDTLTLDRGDWTGEIDQLDCFDVEDDLQIIQVVASVPQGASGSASADAWIVVNPGRPDTTYLQQLTCLPEEVGITFDTLVGSTGCDSLLITTTDLLPPPELALADQYACAGEAALLIAETETVLSYLWSNGETNAFIEASEPGQYTVTVTDANGCTASASAQVSVNEIELVLVPSVAEEFLLSSSPLEVWQGTAVEMSVEVSGTVFPYEIVWNGGPEIGDSIYNYVARQTDVFRVAVVDSLGCIASSEVEILVRPVGVFVPTAFSPNEDGNNDSFDIYTSPNVEEVRLQIFTRRGDLLFDQKLEPGMLTEGGTLWVGWDGFANGQTINPQVLVYQMSFRSVRGEWQIMAGDITLIR